MSKNYEQNFSVGTNFQIRKARQTPTTSPPPSHPTLHPIPTPPPSQSILHPTITLKEDLKHKPFFLFLKFFSKFLENSNQKWSIFVDESQKMRTEVINRTTTFYSLKNC